MDANPYSAPVADPATEAPPLNDPEGIRLAYIGHEASVKSVGTLYVLGAILIGLSAIFNLWVMFSGGGATEASWATIAFLAIISALQFQVGSGLRKLKKSSRAIGAILAGIGLLGFPIGTIISAYILYLLMSRKGTMVFSPEYQQVIAATPHIKYKSSKVMWWFLGIVATIIVIVIALVLFAGFMESRK
ncbi:hypothetical protein [Luteolibacter luteus]|uniref:Uncharacterized protein n=1 Tax=Luteolibacter luteus TaxID=2728835 RepID=A0A858RQM7_9BACT|nr:hypothetical protein [Luteolibacter luteus]QJE99045.1 hypothetical protein HHL09_25780 [Luteolibacter luteus]